MACSTEERPAGGSTEASRRLWGLRKNPEGGENSEGRSGGSKEEVDKTQRPGDEAKDEKGRAEFSFGAMKHLLWLRMSPS